MDLAVLMGGVVVLSVTPIPLALAVYGPTGGAWGQVAAAMIEPPLPIAAARMTAMATLAAICAAAVHELGHAAVGVAFGARSVRLGVGPIALVCGAGPVRLHRTGSWLTPPHAGVGAVPRPSARVFRWISLGGPLASLLLAMIALVAMGWLHLRAMGAAQFAWFVSFVSLLLGGINLLPVRIGWIVTDGGQLWESFGAGAPVAEARLILNGPFTRAVAPRDWPREPIELLARDPRATAMDRAYFVVPWLLDAGRYDEAEVELEALCAAPDALPGPTLRTHGGLWAWLAARRGDRAAARFRIEGARRGEPTIDALLDLELADGAADQPEAAARARAHLRGLGPPDSSFDRVVRELLARRLEDVEQAADAVRSRAGGAAHPRGTSRSAR